MQNRNALKILRAGIVFLCLTSGIVFLCLTSGIYFCFKIFSPSKNKISKILREIPFDERCFLDYFFRELLLRQSGVYVLNGTKPVMLEIFRFPTLWEVIFAGTRFIKRETLLKKGYETWRKYEHLFPSTKYIFLCREDKKEKLFEVLLIHRKRFLKNIEKNICVFKKILGSEITAHALLKNLLQQEKSIFDTLRSHSGLLGVTLGFGRYNSQLFYQREVLENQLNNGQFIPKKISLIEEKLILLNKKLKTTQNKLNKLSLLPLPSFACDLQHPETQELLEKYSQERKTIANSYRSGNFLENFLEKFTS